MSSGILKNHATTSSEVFIANSEQQLIKLSHQELSVGLEQLVFSVLYTIV